MQGVGVVACSHIVTTLTKLHAATRDVDRVWVPRKDDRRVLISKRWTAAKGLWSVTGGVFGEIASRDAMRASQRLY